MKYLFGILIGLIAILMVYICQFERIEDGIIIEKRYNPPLKEPFYYDELVPLFYYDIPENWNFRLKKQERMGWVNVDRNVYEKFQIGDYFSKGGR